MDRQRALEEPPGGEVPGHGSGTRVAPQLAWTLCGLCVALAAVISQFFRFRRARGDERQQTKWFAYAAALTLLWTFLIEVVPDSNRTFEAVTAALGVFVVPSIPIAIGFAIFRYRLYDIDRLINRTLVYAALTGALVAVYVGGGSNLAIVASTPVIAALFNPLRRGIQALIDRRLYRRGYGAAKAFRNFSGRLRDETDLDRLGDALVSGARGTVRPAHIALWLRVPAFDEGRERDV